MKKIYQNFDGLDVTFQCAVPKFILQKLKQAQQEAKDTKQDVIITIGKTPVAVASNGLKGGYAYRFDTGIDGAIWAVAESENREWWNVRVSVKSLMLALYGYKGTKEKILKFLMNELLVRHPQGYTEPVERVSRFDFCIDFIAEDHFVPDPKCFLTHNRSTKKYQGDIPNVSPLDFIIVDQGKEIQGITIGKMPNRQLTIYNKRREIMAKQKIYWWDIWGINPEKIKSNIWRVEVRVGKKALKKQYVRGFLELEKYAGNIISQILHDYRYVIPNYNDKNRSRWPLAPFWKSCIDAASEYLAEYSFNGEREKIIRNYREAIVTQYRKHINGLITSYIAAQGKDISQIPEVLETVGADFIEALRKNPQKAINRYKNAEKRIAFVCGE